VSTRLTSPAAPDAAGSSPFEDSVEQAGAHMVRGGPWQTASHLSPYVMTALISIVAARALGPDGMGRQSYISFIVISAITICSGGFAASMPRYVAELIGKGEDGRILSLYSWARRFGLLAAGTAAAVLLLMAAFGGAPRLAWVFGAIGAFVGILHKVPASVLVGAQRWRQNSFVILSCGVGTTIATMVALQLGGGITSIFVVLAAGNLVMAVWAWTISHRLLARITSPRVALGKVRREVLHFMAVASVPMVLSFVVFQRSEFFFLEHYSTDRQIALYSIAFGLYAALLALPSALSNMFAPAVATLHGAGAHERIQSGFGRGLRLLFIISIPLTAGGIVFGPPLIGLLYGSEYNGAGLLFLVLITPLLVVPAGGLSGGLLFGYGRIRAPVVIGVLAGVIDLGLAAALVPQLDALGAALANVSAQIGAALLGIVYCVRLVGGIQLAPRHLARAVLAAAVAGGCGELILRFVDGAGGLVLAMVVSFVVYAGLAASLRVLPREDADWLVSSVGGRMSGRITWICRRLSGAPLGAVR
jgi:O-antigen/teichoic acid export membrane protein